MAGSSLHLLLTLLAFSFLLSFIHLPTTNARHLVHEFTSPEDTFEGMKQVTNEAEHEWENVEKVENEFLHGRMEFEINRDYPGSGANNRHTPNPPVKE